MKRSEMVNKIEVLLESIGYVGPANSGEKVVQLIENEGMLPPKYEKIINKEFRSKDCELMNRIHSAWSGGYIMDFESVNEWEEEQNEN